MIKVGVVGLGAMGQHHVRVYSELPCILEGVVDVDQGRAEQIADKFKTKCYTNYHDLMSKVDAISLAVPTVLHASVANDFLQQGIHCLVEKPIASTLGEAARMSDIANKYKAKLMIGHIERFNPVVSKLKELIDKGQLGKVAIISTRRVGPFASRIQDTGIVMDSAIHDIDIIMYLMSKNPTQIYSNAGNFNHGVEDHAIIVLDFGDALGCLEVNWLTPNKMRTLVATGSSATCYLDYMKQELQLCTPDGINQIEIRKGEPLKLEIQHFLECIEKDLTPLVDARAATKALEIAIQAEKHHGLINC